MYEGFRTKTAEVFCRLTYAIVHLNRNFLFSPQTNASSSAVILFYVLQAFAVLSFA